jgi:hypothetical protein
LQGWAWCGLIALAGTACSSGTNAAVGGDASIGDGGPLQVQSPAACALDASNGATCLAGTASTGRFSAGSTLAAGLFTGVPIGAQSAVAGEVVGADGTWAFDISALPPDAGGSEYYVQISAQFGLVGTVTRVVGPLSVPLVTPVAVNVPPVHIEVVESGVAEGGALDFRSASAHVFDPSSGAEILDGTAAVAVVVGDTTLAMPWDPLQQQYDVQSPTSLDAQPTYTVTISHPALGSTSTSWRLVANTAPLSGAITAPGADASVDPASPLEVDWAPAPTADYVQLDIFGQQAVPASDGGEGGVGWDPDPVYSSPLPDSPLATGEVVPAGTFAQSGQALINVVYSYATCLATADGCVYSGTVVPETITLVGADGGTAESGAM